MCEEFGCLPDAAEQALENDPEHRILTIISMRAFARAKAEWDAYDPRSKRPPPSGRAAELAKEIEFDEARRQIAESRGLGA